MGQLLYSREKYTRTHPLAAHTHQTKCSTSGYFVGYAVADAFTVTLNPTADVRKQNSYLGVHINSEPNSKTCVNSQDTRVIVVPKPH